MIRLRDFEISKHLHIGHRFILYQGFKKVDGQSIIIKSLNVENPTKQHIARFKREYELLKRLNGQMALKAIDFKESENQYAIIMEDFGGQLLSDYLRKNILTIDKFLNIAIKIITALENIHNFQIIHKDINPMSILWDEAKQEVKIIDFDIACTLSREEPESQNLNTLEGSLVYISPEQTGRMNRGIDYRSDYYSFGILLYEMITGSPPFVSDDVMEMIHAHMAKAPTPPHEISSNIPISISEIILKLLSKTPEERYQSASGIRADLEECLSKYTLHGEIKPFSLGQRDFSFQFYIPEKLYGRKKERAELLNAFKRVSEEGKPEMVLVTGYSGIGKSRLVHEVNQPIAAKHAYFINGKYDQYKRNIPYSAIIQALQELVKKILTESESRIAEWHKRLNQVLGVNGRIVLEVIPELEAVIGPQPPATELGLTETQNRFNLVFQNFITALANKDHPLVIFLDDLQWGDNSSFQFLQKLLMNLDNHYLLILGAYRENEVDSTHPLLMVIDEIGKTGVKVKTIILQPLQLKHVKQLIADAFHHTTDYASSLAEICCKKTQANPFFLLQFLKTLLKEKLIYFSKSLFIWEFDLIKIQKQHYTDNVVEFMANRVRQLPLPTQKALQYATCLGNRFDILTLSVITKKEVSELSQNLWPALAEGLIIPLDDTYQTVTKEHQPEVNYIFAHDRIQQATYSLIAEDKRSSIHLNIGRLLITSTSKAKLNDSLLDIINHLNQGLVLVTDKAELLEIAELNLLSGKKAKASAAYRAALNYFKNGIHILSENSWQEQYQLTLQLYTEAFEAAYLASAFAEMERISQILFKNVQNISDKIKIYEVKLNYLSAQNRFEEAIQLAVEALALFNISFPKRITKFHVFLTLIKIKWLLRGRSIDDLANLPQTTDQKWLAVARIMASAGTVAHLSDLNFFVLILYQLLKLTIKHGMVPQSPNAYIAYGTLLCTVLRDANQGYAFGRLGIKIVDQLQLERQKPQVYVAFCVTNAIWKIHYDDITPILISTFQQGIDVGDLENTGFKAAGLLGDMLISGKDLFHMIEEGEKYGHLLLRLGQITSYKYLLFFWITALHLTGTDVEKIKDLGAYYNDDEMINQSLKSKDFSALAEIYSVKIIVGYFSQDYNTSVTAALIADQYLSPTVETQMTSCLVYFYSALVFLAYYHMVDQKQRKIFLTLIKKYLRKLKFRAKQAPMNYLHKYYVVLGEYYRILKKYEKAIASFDLAIKSAKQNGFVNDEAIASELAAKIYLILKKDKIAKIYMRDAHYLYSRWGAVIKVKQLEACYPDLLSEMTSIKNAFNKVSTVLSTEVSEKELDLTTFIKSAQTISKEMILEDLLRRMMHIVIENAGAQMGYFLLEKNGEWFIEAEFDVDNQTKILESRPVDQSVPLSVLNYVVRRKKSVLIDDAMHDNQFSTDPYIRSQNSKSILCMPLLKHGIVAAILYLENKLAINTFSLKRLELLELLSGQIIISIDNAKLYTDTISLNENLTSANKALVSLNKAYERFVPKQFLNLLERISILDVIEGDQIQKDMTVLFADIRNFTAISEKMTPKENFAFLNEILNYVEPLISAHHGFVDKYFGDGIMALFPTNADDALQTAIAMLHAINKYNRENEDKGKEPIHLGIGLNSGLMTLGTVGTESRMDVTVISDAVNLTSRLEKATKRYHTELLISEDVYLRLRDPSLYSLRKIDYTTVRGRENPTMIYEVFDADPPKTKSIKIQTMKQFEEAMRLYKHHDYAEAKIIFKKIVRKNKFDEIAKHFYKVCLNHE